MKNPFQIIKEKLVEGQITRDKILFFVWPLFASFFSFWLKSGFFITLFLFFGLPTLYLLFRNKKKNMKILMFSSSVFIVAVVFDYIFIATGTWEIPLAKYYILGGASLETSIWFFIWIFFVIAYYEYFTEYAESDVLYKPRLKYLYAFFIFILVVFMLVYFTEKDLLLINYFYLKFLIFFGFLPVIYILLKFPKLFTKFAKTGVYFFYISFVYELTAIPLQSWQFTGKGVVGMVTFGTIAFPVEELFAFIILGSLAILSWYEFFDDDCK